MQPAFTQALKYLRPWNTASPIDAFDVVKRLCRLRSTIVC